MANQNLLQWDWKAWNMLANISFLLTCLLTHAKMFRHLEVKYWRSWFPHVMIHIEPQRSCSENLLMKWNRVREVLEKGFACNEWTVKNLKFLTLVWNLECPMWIYVLNLSASWHTCWELKHLSMCTLLWVCLWLFVRFSTYMGLELRMHVVSTCIVDMSVCLAYCCQILDIQGLELKCPWCISALHLETEKKVQCSWKGTISGLSVKNLTMSLDVH